MHTPNFDQNKSSFFVEVSIVINCCYIFISLTTCVISGIVETRELELGYTNGEEVLCS